MFLASENVPHLLEILRKSMVSSATSPQNPLPWFSIQIKLHSAKQNKKIKPVMHHYEVNYEHTIHAGIICSWMDKG